MNCRMGMYANKTIYIDIENETYDEVDFDVSELRSKLVYEHKIFTGSSSNKNLIRILPPLSIKKNHFDIFFNALNKSL